MELPEETKAAIQEYIESMLKERLSVYVDVNYPRYDNRPSIRVDLCFDGETFSYHSDALPTHG